LSPSDGIAIASLVVALFATYLTYRTGREARESGERLAREDREARAAEARVARLHEVRKEVYPQINEYALLVRDIVEATERRVTFVGDPEPPDWPGLDDMRLRAARFYAAASEAMGQALEALHRSVEAFQTARFEWKNQVPGVPSASAQELADNIEKARYAVSDRVSDVLLVSARELAE
jgi:hypothetical protein